MHQHVATQTHANTNWYILKNPQENLDPNHPFRTHQPIVPLNGHQYLKTHQ